MSLSSLISDSFEKFADKNALKIDQNYYSYKFLYSKSLKISGMLKKITCNPIGIIGQRNISSYLGILGSIFAAKPYVPISIRNSREKIINVIKNAGIEVFVSDKNSYLSIKEYLPHNSKIIFPNEINSEENIIDKNMIDNEDSEIILNNKDTELAYIYFTSGSTGNPKGVKVSTHNVESFLKNMECFYDFPPGFKASQTFDLNFDPSVSDMLFTWFKGGELCVIPEDELLLPFDYIRREQITFWNSVPTLGRFMMNMNLLEENVFPSIICSTFCGEQFPQDLADQWRIAAPNSSIENLYGPTETTIYISRYLYEKNAPKYRNGIVPIGKPFNNHECVIVNEELNPVNKDQTGQIAFTGHQVTKGYLNDKKKTDKAFVKFSWDKQDRIWYLTGDLGFLNLNLDIECIGRADNQIKVAGKRIEIGEIENAILQTNMIKNVYVIAIKDQTGSVKSLEAFTNTKISKEDIRNILNKSEEFIEKVFLPKKITFIEKIPINDSGKVNRKKLLELIS